MAPKESFDDGRAYIEDNSSDRNGVAGVPEKQASARKSPIVCVRRTYYGERGNNERERRLVQGAGMFNREGARTGAMGS